MAKKIKDSKSQIIKAALECYIKQGIIGTSNSDIAKRAKVHQPLISYYFKNFEELYIATLNILLEDLKDISISAIAKYPGDTYKALLAYSEAPLRWTELKPQYTSIWTFFYHMASYSPPFIQLNNAIRSGGIDRISLLLFKIQEEKKLKLKDNWDITELAYTIQTHINGAMVMANTQDTDIKAAAKKCRQGVTALIVGAFEASEKLTATESETGKGSAVAKKN